MLMEANMIPNSLIFPRLSFLITTKMFGVQNIISLITAKKRPF
jgi:hypothetical protein